MADTVMEPWRDTLSWAQMTTKPITMRFLADGHARRLVADRLQLEAVIDLMAEAKIRPWTDGAEVDLAVEATVTRTCGITLELYDESVSETLTFRVVPPGAESDIASDGGDITFTLNDDDPPDIIAGGAVDLAAYVVEVLSLGLAPFPRKPGVTFHAPDSGASVSPFAALATLRKGAKSD